MLSCALAGLWQRGESEVVSEIHEPFYTFQRILKIEQVQIRTGLLYLSMVAKLSQNSTDVCLLNRHWARSVRARVLWNRAE